ncbi:LysE family translocator [Synechococcus elongatus]|uniref:LysE family translocator n=1 Tax=Synechococcus elongatus TaxID=32046 RepID=UPI0030D0D4A2
MMTIQQWLALGFAMLLLTALPSLSVLTVVTRSASLGLWHGALTTAGIVLGDCLWILLALVGLEQVAQFESWLPLLRALSGSYLIVLGIELWRSRDRVRAELPLKQTSQPASFLAGLLLTLADQKALLFYLGFFPTFLNLERITLQEIAGVIAIAVGTIGGVKLTYAWLAVQGRQRLISRHQRWLQAIASGLLITIGLLLWLQLIWGR